MKREELFEAIGEIEETRLARSEKKEVVTTGRKIWRVMLVAAIVASLATTAFAYVGFVVYENPRVMLEAFFGEQPVPHGPDCNCAECRATEPTYEREPLNTEVANELVAPFISEVGDSFVYEETGYKFTVDAHTYDSVTGCGLLYYTMERTEDYAEYPIDYNLEENGEIWGVGDPLSVPSCTFLIQEESTPYKLKIAAYYYRNGLHEDDPNLVFSFGNEIYDDETGELIGYDPDLSLHLPFDDGGGMKSLTLADGKIVLSPIGMVIQGDILPEDTYESSQELNVERLVIKYVDGSEYLVKEDAEIMVINYAMASAELVDEETELYKTIYNLNRIVDIDNVTAVIINGVEFPIE